MNIIKTKKIEDQKKLYIRIGWSFLTAYALSVVFHAPFFMGQFETKIDYVIASVYELLGEYNFNSLLIFCMAFLFYKYLEERIGQPKKNVSNGIAAFFSFSILIGRSYQELGNWGYYFGSIINVVKFILALMGFFILFKSILDVCTVILEKSSFISSEKHFWSTHGFYKAFAILCAAYLPFLIIAFPGNICWDTLGQIEQVVYQTGYSLHHPLAHTLLVGGMTKLGGDLLGSYEAGLFCYMLIQLMALAASLAFTIMVLAKRGLKKELLWILLILYSITPVYSNMASTAIKDLPYASAMTGYMVCLALIMEKPERLKKTGFMLGFVMLQIAVVLLRNNGIYVILLSAVMILFYFRKQYSWKAMGRRLFIIFMGSVLAGLFLTQLLAFLCHAEKGSMGEMLSVPFQQTARYLQYYGDEITQEEKAAIETILGDTEELAERYDPVSADPVKAKFHKDASWSEIFHYLQQWLHGLQKHPAVYIEAFLAHVYGWFSPEISNSIRYEAEYDLIRQGGLFANAEKILIFYYRFAARFTPLGILENIGIAVWALIFLTFYQKKHMHKKYMVAGIPLWVSLLVCMMSPGFLKHARYGFPILFSIPFLYGFTMTAGENGEKTNGQGIFN